MSSICSFSDGSPQLVESAKSIIDIEPSPIFYRCENCKSMFKSKLVDETKIARLCQRCQNSVNDPLITIQTPDSISINVPIEDSKTDHTDQTIHKETKGNNVKPNSLNKLNETSEGKDKSSVRSATFFDIAVMRCLLCPKWNHEGYLWALEYLCYRTTEITDYTLKEQDRFFKFKSASMPYNLDEICIQMGIGSNDSSDNPTSNRSMYNNKKSGYNNQFIDLINQIYIETDLTNPKYTFNSLFDFSKRKKYEANFHTRIR